MQIGIIGLGRMGSNMASRLSNDNHEVYAYDRDPDIRSGMLRSSPTITILDSLEDLASSLPSPRVIIVMVPSGNPTEATISALSDVLEKNDIIIDGGNSNYKDSMRRSADLQHQGIRMIDAGISGGIWGLDQGYCLMVGGAVDAVKIVEPVFRSLAPTPQSGYAHVGDIGAGHFTKMIHNGIEYGLMQAYAEGFELMSAKDLFQLDLAQIAEVWRHSSVIRSWLLDLTAAALNDDADLASIEPWVEDSGEGRWAIEESVDLAVPVPVMAMALQARFRSRDQSQFEFKLLAAMRNQFGGHSIRRKSKPYN